MAEPRFLLRTDLAGLRPAEAGGAPVLDQHAALAARLGVAAGLFAEPVVTWGNGPNAGSVSWYAPLGAEPLPLAALSPERRAAAEARLAARLAALAPLAADPVFAAMLRAALQLADRDGIRVLDGEVVLTGWGLVPADEPAEPARRLEALYGAALPPGLAGEPASPPATASAPNPPATPPPPRPPQAAGGEPPRPPTPPPAAPYAPIPPGPRPRAAAALPAWLLPAALAVALLFLALGFWLGWRLVSERIAATTLTAELVDAERLARQAALQEASNRALREEISATRAALEGDVCRLEPGRLPDLPPPARTPVQPAQLAPPPPGAAPFGGSLLELLDSATVLVIGPQRDGGIGIGSGFVVAPGVVATNAHVVANLDPARVHVINRRLGRTVRVAVQALTTTDPQPGSVDFAILRLPPDAAPLQPLALSREVARLDRVVAAGFPASIMQTDANFRALLDGNLQAIPEMAVTDGLISAIQPLPSGLVVMPHTAAIGRGNSGGPLADRCGRVVGMNTFGFVDAQAAERVSYAQKTDALLAFLAAQGVAPSEAAGPCQPAAEAAPATPPAAPGGTTPPAAPGGTTPPAASGGTAPPAASGGTAPPAASGGTAPAPTGPAAPATPPAPPAR